MKHLIHQNLNALPRRTGHGRRTTLNESRDKRRGPDKPRSRLKSQKNGDPKRKSAKPKTEANRPRAGEKRADCGREAAAPGKALDKKTAVRKSSKRTKVSVKDKKKTAEQVKWEVDSMTSIAEGIQTAKKTARESSEREAEKKQGTGNGGEAGLRKLKPENKNYLIVQQMRRLKKESGKARGRRKVGAKGASLFPAKSTRNLAKRLETSAKSKHKKVQFEEFARVYPTEEKTGKKSKKVAKLRIKPEPRLDLHELLSPIESVHVNKLNISVDNSKAFINNSINKSLASQEPKFGEQTSFASRSKYNSLPNNVENGAQKSGTGPANLGAKTSKFKEQRYMEYYELV